MPELVVVESVACTGPGAVPPRTNDPVQIDVLARSVGEQRSARWYIDLLAGNQQVCVARLEPPPGDDVVELSPEGTHLSCRIPHLPLFPGGFQVIAHFSDPVTGGPIGESEACALEVDGRGTRLETLAQIPGILCIMQGRFEVGAASAGDSVAAVEGDGAGR